MKQDTGKTESADVCKATEGKDQSPYSSLHGGENIQRDKCVQGTKPVLIFSGMHKKYSHENINYVLESNLSFLSDHFSYKTTQSRAVINHLFYVTVTT